MIVSMAMAVLPVCRSPMISSRWPRPIGVIASIALIPVCSGSLTFCRCTTDGACSSSSRSWVPSISPLPSSGTPSGSTTRPRNPSPTGTDSTSPVPRTCWPSSTLLKSPRMTTPISRMSRLSARPRIPPGNSSSSFAIAEGSPSTCAIPSPQSATVPTSCLEAASGSYDSTKLASASRISSGRIVSSAMSLHLSRQNARALGLWAALAAPAGPRQPCTRLARYSCRQPLPEFGEAATHRPVDELITDLDGYAAHNLRILHDIQLNAVAVDGRQRRREPLALGLGQRAGDAHRGNQPVPPGRDEPGAVRQVRFQATSPGVQGDLGDQPQRRLRHLAFEQGVQQFALAVVGQQPTGQGRVQFWLGGVDPAEPEQLVLNVVKRARALGRCRRGHHGELLGSVRQVPRHRPPGGGHAG